MWTKVFSITFCRVSHIVPGAWVLRRRALSPCPAQLSKRHSEKNDRKNKNVHKSGNQENQNRIEECLKRYLTSSQVDVRELQLVTTRSKLFNWNKALTTSFSRKFARIAIWFSLTRRASRERLAAILFLRRRAQYLSSFKSSGTY